ncbi:MAG: radical SAM protein [Candidatus Omnitrophica bacterium]|nr:radical SAM protein [Candidatus Omnitrophota bacterium]
MKEIDSRDFLNRLHNRKGHFPLRGLLELTYQCNLNCVHCYCKGSEDKARELNTEEWKEILAQLHKEGCIFITFSGGEPLLRQDFIELYAYARERGFIITIFTNATVLTKQIIGFFKRFPPSKIEITLNGITRSTYESITQAEGSFEKVIKNIIKLETNGMPVLLKANLLKQNKDEIKKIKAFADQFFGKKEDRFHFKYDPMIYPRLNSDRGPCQYRLSHQEMIEAMQEDSDIWDQYQASLHKDARHAKRDSIFLYHCNSWLQQFFINPFGRLKFCEYSEKFSSDLKKEPFKKGFYEKFPKVLNESFQTESKCRDCNLRHLCYYCPARAFLETGDKESPVEHYCALAHGLKKAIQAEQSKDKERRRRIEVPIIQ